MSSNYLKKENKPLFGKVYKFRTLSKVIVGSLLVFTGLFLISFGFFGPGKEKDDYAVLIWGILFVIGGCLYLRQWYFNRGLIIQVSENGLDITDKNLKKTKILWNEIEEVKQNKRFFPFIPPIIVPFSTYEYKIITTDGTKININDSVKDVKELGKLIQNRTYEFQFPRFKKMYDEGGTISFGKLSISQFGITKNNVNISWKDIKKIEVKDGYVHIFKGKILRWHSTPVSKLRNFYLFTSLVNDIMAGKM
jgi:hypothetical protein